MRDGRAIRPTIAVADAILLAGSQGGFHFLDIFMRYVHRLDLSAYLCTDLRRSLCDLLRTPSGSGLHISSSVTMSPKNAAEAAAIGSAIAAVLALLLVVDKAKVKLVNTCTSKACARKPGLSPPPGTMMPVLLTLMRLFAGSALLSSFLHVLRSVITSCVAWVCLG